MTAFLPLVHLCRTGNECAGSREQTRLARGCGEERRPFCPSASAPGRSRPGPENTPWRLAARQCLNGRYDEAEEYDPRINVKYGSQKDLNDADRFFAGDVVLTGGWLDMFSDVGQQPHAGTELLHLPISTVADGRVYPTLSPVLI